MSEIETKKSEVYDLMMQQAQVNTQLQNLTQVINQKVQEIQKLNSEKEKVIENK